MAGLTPREREILRLRADGMPVKQAARVMGIALQTARNHIKSAYVKLGVNCLADALQVLGMIGSGDRLIERLIDIEEAQHRARIAFLRSLMEAS